jgi:hypothetical protein
MTKSNVERAVAQPDDLRVPLTSVIYSVLPGDRLPEGVATDALGPGWQGKRYLVAQSVSVPAGFNPLKLLAQAAQNKEHQRPLPKPTITYRVSEVSLDSPLYREILSHIDSVLNSYVSREIVSKDATIDFAALERSLDVERCTYLTYIDARNGGTKIVMRMFDGTVSKNVGFRQFMFDSGTSSMPLKIEYPHLKFEDRSIEFGRLDKTLDVSGDIEPLLSMISARLYGEHPEAMPATGDRHRIMIYIEATEQGTAFYRRKYGFSIKYTPEQTGKSDRYILEIDAFDFARSHPFLNLIFPVLKPQGPS